MEIIQQYEFNSQSGLSQRNKSVAKHENKFTGTCDCNNSMLGNSERLRPEYCCDIKYRQIL